MTPYLTHLLTLSNAATEGPWRVVTNPGVDQPAFPYVTDSSGLPHGEDIVTQPLGDSQTVKANAAFIAEARTAVPRLVEMVRVLDEALRNVTENLTCEHMLAYYAPGPFSKAKAALARVEQLVKTLDDSRKD